MTENHKKFLGHLRKSQEAVGAVAKWLVAQGRDVTIKGMDFAPNHGQWKSYADGGDIFITKRIEVKRLGVEFTSAKDWPFGRKFIVCAKHAWDLATDKPACFVILSDSMANAAFVGGETSSKWYSEQRTDSRYSGNAATQEFYFCPLDLVKFRKLDNEDSP